MQAVSQNETHGYLVKEAHTVLDKELLQKSVSKNSVSAEVSQYSRIYRKLRSPKIAELAKLFECRGADFSYVTRAADDLRKKYNGDDVTYVVNRNINYTNVCYFKCQFCAFSKGKASENFVASHMTLVPRRSLDDAKRLGLAAPPRFACKVVSILTILAKHT